MPSPWCSRTPRPGVLKRRSLRRGGRPGRRDDAPSSGAVWDKATNKPSSTAVLDEAVQAGKPCWTKPRWTSPCWATFHGQ